MYWWKPADKRFNSALAIALLSLTACAPLRPQSDAQLPLLPADSWDSTFQLNQSAAIKGQRNALLLVLIKRKDTLEVNVLSSLGQRLLQLTHDTNGLRTVEHWPEITLPADTMLRQLQAALWPIETLRAHYPAPWKVKESDCQRHITYRQTLLLTVNYCAHQQGDHHHRLEGANDQ